MEKKWQFENCLLCQVKVRETDQGWIFGNYTCQASNDLGTSNIVIELKRASEFKKIKSHLNNNGNCNCNCNGNYGNWF